MEYHIHACYDTPFGHIVLRKEGETAVLVGDGNYLELQVCSPSLLLVALPWNTEETHVVVNHVRYASGPLVLRDGDAVLLVAAAAGGSTPGNARDGYAYQISRKQQEADPNSTAKKGNGAQSSLMSSSHVLPQVQTDIDRCQILQDNLATYAKWNNYYQYHYGNLSTMTKHGDEAGGRIWTAVLDGGAAASSLPSQRILVTMLPSLPTLLSTSTSAEELMPQSLQDVGVAASCCDCPVWRATRSGALDCSGPLKESAVDAANIWSRNLSGPPSCSAKKKEKGRSSAPSNPWSDYMSRATASLVAGRAARQRSDPVGSLSAGGAAADSVTYQDLLQRVGLVESALRYPYYV